MLIQCLNIEFHIKKIKMQKNLNYLIFNILNYPLRLRKLKKKEKKP